jgi:hypothetical protein
MPQAGITAVAHHAQLLATPSTVPSKEIHSGNFTSRSKQRTPCGPPARMQRGLSPNTIVIFPPILPHRLQVAADGTRVGQS